MLADQLWAVHHNAYGYAVRARAEADKDQLEEVVHRNDLRNRASGGSRPSRNGRAHAHDREFRAKLRWPTETYRSQAVRPLPIVYYRAGKHGALDLDPGDVVIWDSRAAQSSASNGSGEQHRESRATTDGNVSPSVDVHGRRRSVKVAGSQASYALRWHAKPQVPIALLPLKPSGSQLLARSGAQMQRSIRSWQVFRTGDRRDCLDQTGFNPRCRRKMWQNVQSPIVGRPVLNLSVGVICRVERRSRRISSR